MDNNLRKFRLMKDVTQEELSNATGVSRQTINSLERGRTNNPKYETIMVISEYFGVPIDEIFFKHCVSHVLQSGRESI